MTDKKNLTEQEIDQIAGGSESELITITKSDLIKQKPCPFGPPPKPAPNPFANK